MTLRRELMKKLALLFAVSIMAYAFAVQDMTGKWEKLTWKGYEPYPNIKTQDGVLSIDNITASHGFEMRSKVYFPAKSGDRVILNATIKGKGKMFFRVQCFAYNPKTKTDNYWTGIANEKDTIDIPAEWENVQLSVPVVDLSKGQTTKA